MRPGSSGDKNYFAITLRYCFVVVFLFFVLGGGGGVTQRMQFVI